MVRFPLLIAHGGPDYRSVTESFGKQAKNVVEDVCQQRGSEGAYRRVLKKGTGPPKGTERSARQH